MTKLKLNLDGFRALRTGPAAEQLLDDTAARVVAAAGPGFVAKRSPSANRARVVVVPDTAEAAVESAREPAKLIAALEAGRG